MTTTETPTPELVTELRDDADLAERDGWHAGARRFRVAADRLDSLTARLAAVEQYREQARLFLVEQAMRRPRDEDGYSMSYRDGYVAAVRAVVADLPGAKESGGD